MRENLRFSDQLHKFQVMEEFQFKPINWCTLINNWKAIHVVAKIGLPAFASNKRESDSLEALLERIPKTQHQLYIVTKPYFLFSGQMIQTLPFISHNVWSLRWVKTKKTWKNKGMQSGKFESKALHACTYKNAAFYGILCD